MTVAAEGRIGCLGRRHFLCLIYIGQGHLGALSEVQPPMHFGNCTETSALLSNGEMKNRMVGGHGI